MAMDHPDVVIHPRNHALSVTLCGRGNSISVASEKWSGRIVVYGCGNTVRIAEDAYTDSPCLIRIGLPDAPCFNCCCTIGKGTGMGGVDISLFDDESRVEVGEDCMFSTDIRLWCSDSHAVYDGEGKLRLGRFITIGNHVWVGMRCLIGKNSRIADGSIVGWGSVVAGCFDTPHSLIAGAPAAVRKHGVSWSRERASNHVEGRQEALAAFREAAPKKRVVAPRVAQRRLYYLFRSVFSFTAAKRARYREKAQNLRVILDGTPF